MLIINAMYVRAFMLVDRVDAFALLSSGNDSFI